MSIIKLLIESISSKKEEALKERIIKNLLKVIPNINKFKDGNKAEVDFKHFKPINFSFDFLQICKKIDPTKKGRYLNWIIDKTFDDSTYKNEIEGYYKNGQYKIMFSEYSNWLIEDIGKHNRNLRVFQILKNRNILSGNEADINQYKSFDELYQKVKPYLDNPDFLGTKKENIMRDTEIIYDQSQIKIVVPKTYKASCFWGSGTNWCTAVDDGDPTTFKGYSDDAPLFIIILFPETDRKRKFQLHWSVRYGVQLMNEDDELAIKELSDLTKDTLFNDIMGMYLMYDSKEYSNKFEDLLLNMDSFSNELRSEQGDNLEYIIKWNDFLPNEANDIIHEMMKQYVKWLKKFPVYKNTEKKLIKNVEEIEEKGSYNNIKIDKIFDGISTSLAINFITGGMYDKKLFKELEKVVYNYYRKIMKVTI